jgi:hypothetical protein
MDKMKPISESMPKRKNGIYLCEICEKPMPEYEPKFCCSGTMEMACGCRGLPINPQICSDRCWKAACDGIGKTMEQRRIDAGIVRYKRV